jgi:LCP family protein required for cell wall assembly
MTPSPPTSSSDLPPTDRRPVTPSPRRGTSPLKVIGIVVLLVVLGVIGFGLVVLMHFLRHGSTPGQPQTGIGSGFGDIWQIATDPRSGFPGKDKIVVCCMGIDDNWTNSDEVYTVGARTDTLFLLTLDLANKKATMLSIPRDTYVPIAGTNYSDKINSAFASGGPARTEATVQQWLGVNPDYYLVLNIDATKRLVDALGGVDVDVEHQMDYDDNWGQLHVHLKPGFQHLDGNDAVGFARYRHGNHGVTPEDGDERRMYRQHVLLRAMVAKTKSFSSIVQANQLLDTAMDCIRTNMSRQQLADLAAIYHSMNQDTDITTASLEGEDGRGPHGAYVMLVDQNEAKEYVEWLVLGDASAARALTPVIIKNTTATTGLAAKAAESLRQAGYTDVVVSSVKPLTAGQVTQINDSGVPDRTASTDVAATLGITDASFTDVKAQPNHLGWAPPPVVTVNLGADYATSAPAGAPAPTVQ